MSRLVQFPKVRILSNGIRAVPGAKAFIYEAGTTTPLVTYGDSALTAAQAHPVVADAYGTFGPIYLPDTVASYKIRVTNNAGSELWTEDNVPTAGSSGSTGGSTVSYPRSADEIAANITPTDDTWPVGDIRRYGAVADPNGASAAESNNTAIRAALTVAGVRGTHAYIPANANYWAVSDEFILPAKVTVLGDGYSSQIRQATAERNAFILGNDCTIRNVYLRGTDAVTGSSFTKHCGVYGSGVRNVVVENIYASHWYAAGVQLRECTNYKVVDNILFQGPTATDANSSQSDILVYSLTAGSRGIISRNVCCSNVRGAGIFVNAIGYDTDIVISDNVVVTLNSAWGEESQANVRRRHGILASYQSTGTGGGRTVVSGNVVRNCTRTGIYRASAVLPTQPTLISGNIVSNVGWDTVEPSLAGGIFVNNGGAGDEINGNIVTNFLGTAAFGNAAIVVTGSDSANPGTVRVSGNRCRASAGHGILVANNIRNVTVSENVLENNASHNIVVSHSAGVATCGGHVITRNKVDGAAAAIAGIYLDLQAATVAVHVTENMLRGFNYFTADVTNSGVYMAQGSCPVYVRNNTIGNYQFAVNIRNNIPAGRGSMPNVVRNNIYTCGIGVYAVGAGAADTLAVVGNSFRDVTYGTQVCAYNVDYTIGPMYVMHGNAEMSTGTWELGDRVISLSPVVGAGKIGWICTVGGAPGTWKAYGTIEA